MSSDRSFHGKTMGALSVSNSDEMTYKFPQLLENKIGESKTGWAANTTNMSIADLKLFTELFALFSGNYDGIEATVISRYPNLLKYHSKVANDERILNHYSSITEDNIRWTFLPGAFD